MFYNSLQSKEQREQRGSTRFDWFLSSDFSLCKDHQISPFKDPGKMKKPLFRLLYTVKMIFDVSTFYNRFSHNISVDSDWSFSARRGWRPSLWRSPTKWSAVASATSLRTATWRYGLRQDLVEVKAIITRWDQRYHSDHHNSHQQEETQNVASVSSGFCTIIGLSGNCAMSTMLMSQYSIKPEFHQ